MLIIDDDNLWYESLEDHTILFLTLLLVAGSSTGFLPQILA
jgi:hypothetical protein